MPKPKKKLPQQKTEDLSGDVDKKVGGRPRTLPASLDKRKQIRCATRDFEAWVERSRSVGFPDVSAWIRKVCNDALKQPAR